MEENEFKSSIIVLAIFQTLYTWKLMIIVPRMLCIDHGDVFKITWKYIGILSLNFINWIYLFKYYIKFSFIAELYVRL